MAKRKRAPHEKPFSRPMQKAAGDGDTAVTEAAVTEVAVIERTGSIEATGGGAHRNNAPIVETPNAGVADQFIGQWNRLISTTNWDKGQIICQWREALMASGVAVTEYSDEAWAGLVGGVTSQHVGRLRRVYQRFGEVATQYEGLHWSHFQACLDWDDAEMWLEGSIQNNWSVSQMRGRRWETVGATPEEQRAEVARDVAQQSTEAQAEDALAQSASADRESPEVSDSLTPSTTKVSSLSESTDHAGDELPSSGQKAPTESASADPVNKRTRLSVDVESLPDDLAEAFESFKLAIIAHRRENWRDTTPESVVECLESLKQLVTAEAE